jgi:hypothetical protein
VDSAPEPQDRTGGAHAHEDHDQYPLVRPGRRQDSIGVPRIERPHVVADLCQRRRAAVERDIGMDMLPVVTGEVAIQDAPLVLLARRELECLELARRVARSPGPRSTEPNPSAAAIAKTINPGATKRLTMTVAVLSQRLHLAQTPRSGCTTCRGSERVAGSPPDDPVPVTYPNAHDADPTLAGNDCS